MREVADAAPSVVIRPAAGRCRSHLLVVEAFLVHGLQENLLRILVVLHVVLLVCDDEVADALRDGVVWILYPDLERADGRVADIRSTKHVAEIRIGQTDVSDVVQEQRRPAILHEGANGLALLRLHPELRLRCRLWCGRVERELRTTGRDPPGVGGLVGIAVGPDHSVAKNNEQLVAVERLGVQHRGFVAEVHRDTHLLLDGTSQADADVIGVMVAVADQCERGCFRRGAAHRGGEHCASQGGKRGTSSDHRWQRLYRETRRSNHSLRHKRLDRLSRFAGLRQRDRQVYNC